MPFVFRLSKAQIKIEFSNDDIYSQKKLEPLERQSIFHHHCEKPCTPKQYLYPITPSY